MSSVLFAIRRCNAMRMTACLLSLRSNRGHLCLFEPYREKSTLRKLKGAPEVLRNSPKKPRTPFLMFLEEIRSRIQDEEPGLSMKEVVKKVSEEYHKLSNAMKEAYIARYQAEMQEFRIESTKYYSSLSDEEKAKLAEFKAKHKEEAVQKKKRAQYRALNPPKKTFGPTMMVEAAQKWREMTEIEKQPYQDKAAAAVIRYREEMRDFQILHGINSAAPVAIEKPKPAFALFLAHQMETGAISKEEKSMVDVAHEARHQWITMTEKERKPFQLRATRDRKEYEEKIEVYKKNVVTKRRTKLMKE
ncbi:high mobility group protein B4-like isoform X2 [Corticium candelabrum]|uniref:high mobility group protein B4-like isoform X2 n=1 Tax=Corticium candelabrum TaxID=121492 RepID=UPI002E260F4D|nr:high mobility group protein B4-like isoform X2 [Corticium candelabrum]